jgi:hypothetical protein
MKEILDLLQSPPFCQQVDSLTNTMICYHHVILVTFFIIIVIIIIIMNTLQFTNQQIKDTTTPKGSSTAHSRDQPIKTITNK